MTDIGIKQLVARATAFSKKETVLFYNDDEMNRRVREFFVAYPHLYVLCCLMDKQIDAARAWKIPFKVCESFGVRNVFDMNRISEERYLAFFNEKKLHRFNDSMAKVFKSALERIVVVYSGDASNIWKGKPSSATVITRFLEFDGCGIKIATMATNLLHRALSVKYSDYYSVDISPDVHIMRVMDRLGLLPADKANDRTLAIYRAREINPQYPGVLDGYFWDIGKNYCHPSVPSCQKCPLNDLCMHYGEKRI